MKKLIISIFLTLCFVFAANTQTVLISISGQVTNDSGLPVSNHTVHISTDSINPGFSYFKTIVTDFNGFYVDTILIPINSQILFHIFTFDCVNYKHETFLTSSNPPLIANFPISFLLV